MIGVKQHKQNDAIDAKKSDDVEFSNAGNAINGL